MVGRKVVLDDVHPSSMQGCQLSVSVLAFSKILISFRGDILVLTVSREQTIFLFLSTFLHVIFHMLSYLAAFVLATFSRVSSDIQVGICASLLQDGRSWSGCSRSFSCFMIRRRGQIDQTSMADVWAGSSEALQLEKLRSWKTSS